MPNILEVIGILSILLLIIYIIILVFRKLKGNKNLIKKPRLYVDKFLYSSTC